MIARTIAIAVAAAFFASNAGAGVTPSRCSSQGFTAPSAANSHVSSQYPVLSIALHEEGEATIAFVIGTDGKTSGLAVSRSSGSLRLDDASMEAVRGWLYNPALSGGVPTACIQFAAVRWRIPEAEPPKTAP